MNYTYGEVTWDDPSFEESEKKNSKDLFLRLDSGDNEMRLLTQPYQYLAHAYKKEGEPGFGRKVNCSKAHGSCPLCDVGNKPYRRWLLGVISRKTNTYKIIDVKISVLNQIRKYNKNVRWGDPSKYDINIVVDKNGGANGYYTVQPIPKEPLSAADQVIKDSVDYEDLKRRITPPTPEAVQKIIDFINKSQDEQKSNDKSSKPVAKKQTVAPTPVQTSDEEDESFPAYDSE